MNNTNRNTSLIQWHNAIELFDYNLAIDWAIELVQQGIEIESLLIIASFSKPVDRYEINPYVSAALKDLNIEEKYGESWAIVYTNYFLSFILEKQNVKSNLREVADICMRSDYNFGLGPLYSLYWAWIDLEEQNYQHYYEGVTLENIDEILQKEARNWVDNYMPI